MSVQDAIRAFDRFHRAAERPAGEAADDGDTVEKVHDRARNGATRAGAPGSAPMARLNGSAFRGAPVSGLSGPAINGSAVNGSAVNGSAVSGSSDGSARAEPERTSGSGLGLSIVQAIANAHGGHATLESLPGQGTKVRVWLPVRIVP
jgi:hypothetical protein